MAGGNEIKNELTLDNSNFNKGIDEAAQKIDKLNSRLDKLDAKSDRLEKDLQGLGVNAKQASNKLGAVTDNLDGLAGGLDRVHKAAKKSGDGSRRFKQDLHEIAKEASKSESALASMGDWTAFYGKALDKLRPKMDALVTSQKELAKVTEKSTKAEAKAIQSGIQNRIKDLSSEKAINGERIKARREMVSQLERIERRAESAAAFARQDAYKVNANGKEVRRYVGKNSGRHSELMAEIESYKKQADLARQQRANIGAIVGELQYRNNELAKALQAEQALLNANKQTLAAEKERVAQLKQTAEEKKRVADEEKRLLKELEAEQKKLDKQRADEDRRIAAENKRQAQEEKRRLKDRRDDVKAAVREEEQEEKRLNQINAQNARDEERRLKQRRDDVKAAVREEEQEEKRLGQLNAQAAKEEARRLQEKRNDVKAAFAEQDRMLKEQERQKRQAHNEQMKRLREEMSHHKEMAAFMTGAATVGATREGIHQAANYQDVQDRLRAYNFSQEEFDEIQARTDNLVKNNKFISKTDALQGNIDAISALAHNDPKFIDATLEKVMRDAFILKAKGYDKSSLSDITKNLYGAIESRGLQTDSDAAVKASDLMRRMVIASGGKVTVSDIETVFRNAGDTTMTISDEGWLKILPLIEQNKTAGGGNGGGGGVARVGTMIKMLSLMASGRKLTNRAALDFLGADMMNEAYADGVNQDFDKIAQTNSVIQKSLVHAGFKNQKQVQEDPIGALMSMRGGIIDYMMRDDKFKQFFGSDAKKHSYTKEGRMIDSEGKEVADKEQNAIEMAALKRFFAMSGISNNNVTGMLTAMNAPFAERAMYSVETAKNSKGQDELLKDLENNWNQSIIELKASMANLAITFEPLVEQLTKIPQLITNITRGITEFSSSNNGIASVALAFVGLKVAMFAIFGPLGLIVRALTAGKTSSTSFGAAAVTSTSLAARGFDKLRNSALGSALAIKSANQAVDASNAKTAQGIQKVGDEATKSTSKIGALATGTMRIIGGLIGWLGWASLIAVVVGVVAGWVGEFEVGGLKIKEHVHNMVLNIKSSFLDLFTSLRLAWLSFTRAFGADNEQMAADIRKRKAEIQEQNEASRFKTRAEQANYNTKQWSLEQRKVFEGKTIGDTVKIGDKEYKITKEDAVNLGWARHHANIDSNYAPNQTTGGYVKAPQFNTKTELGNFLANDYNKALRTAGNWAAVEKKTEPAKVVEKKTDGIQGWSGSTDAARGPDAPLPTAIGDPNKRNGGNKSFEQQNAFFADFQNQRFAAVKDNFKLNELLGNPVGYQEQARAEFNKKWLAGEFDDGRDPSKRKFVKGDAAYNKDVGWNLSQLDTSKKDPISGISGNDWIEVVANKIKVKAEQEAAEFAAGKLGESKSRLADSIDVFNLGVNADSSQTSAAKRQYLKREQKDPQATKGSSAYQDFKALSLAALAGEEYISKVTEYRKANYENAKEFDEDEIANTRHVTKVKYEEDLKQREAYVENLRLSLIDLENRGLQEQAIYTQLKDKFESTREIMTEVNRRELEKQLRDTESSYDKEMRLWRDHNKNITETLGGYGQRAATDIWGIITGDKKLDIGGFIGDMMKDVGGDLFKSVWGSASEKIMGRGEGTSALDYLKNITQGTEANSTSVVGRMINGTRSSGFLSTAGGMLSSALGSIGSKIESSRESGGLLGKIASGASGLFGKFFNKDSNSGEGQGFFGKILGKASGLIGSIFGQGGSSSELTGDQALNANTSALQKLSETLSRTLLGRTPTALPSDQAPSNVEIVPWWQREAVDPNEGPNDGSQGGLFGGIFDKLKSGFGSIFNSSGEGGIFANIKSGFSNLFSENGGLMSKIGGSLGGILGNLGGALGSLLGGSGGGGGLGGALGGALQGFQSGGWMGALMGGISGLFANGGAFGSGGQVHAFAKGGAFTNQIVKSPTLFKFAKGGGFANGVMGEAGPEAVMPLQRDGSGRLGVAVNGGAMGGGMVNNVNISINVESDGSTSQSSSDSGSDWNGLAVKVKSLVQQEIVNQKRPGGMLRSTN